MRHEVITKTATEQMPPPDKVQEHLQTAYDSLQNLSRHSRTAHRAVGGVRFLERAEAYAYAASLLNAAAAASGVILQTNQTTAV